MSTSATCRIILNLEDKSQVLERRVVMFSNNRKTANFVATSRKHYFFVISGVASLGLLLGFLSVQYGASGIALEISGNTITVRKGGDFQAALNRARPGDGARGRTGSGVAQRG